MALGQESLATILRLGDNPARMTSVKRCLFCRKPPRTGGLCSLHYQRSRRRKKDGTLPTIQEVAGLESKDKRPAPTHRFSGRVDDAGLARIRRGIAMGKAGSIYELMSRLAAQYDPEKDPGA